MIGMKSKLAAVIVFVVGLIAVRYGFDAYRERATITRVQRSFEGVKEEATRRHPDLSTSEAMRLAAVEKSSEALKTEQDETKRRATAASSFMGFYLVNTKARAEFCREVGVDIASFVTAFERAHAAELAKARTVLSAVPVSEEKLYEMLKPQLRQVIAQDMKDLAGATSASLKDACGLVSANGPALAADIHISKAQPAVYQALMGGP